MVNGTQMTLDEFTQETFREQTVGASDSLAKTSVLPEGSEEFKRIAQDSFSELCILLDSSKKKRSLNGYSSRMLRICFQLMADGISPGFSVAWTRVGTMRSGRFSTVMNSEYHRTGRGASLSDILEDETDIKYYLSAEQINRIVWSA